MVTTATLGVRGRKLETKMRNLLTDELIGKLWHQRNKRPKMLMLLQDVRLKLEASLAQDEAEVGAVAKTDQSHPLRAIHTDQSKRSFQTSCLKQGLICNSLNDTP